VGFFMWLEGTAISEWVRMSPSLLAFPFILYLHTLGLAMVAGLSSAIALCLLIGGRPAAASPLLKLFPLIWIGFAINVLSGIALLMAYPAKALTNPVFYIKLVAIALGISIVKWLQTTLAPSAAAPAAAAKLKLAAGSLLGAWLIATLTGRLLAYTHSILLVGDGWMF
jgi:hypothetical protein